MRFTLFYFLPLILLTSAMYASEQLTSGQALLLEVETYRAQKLMQAIEGQEKGHVALGDSLKIAQSFGSEGSQIVSLALNAGRWEYLEDVVLCALDKKSDESRKLQPLICQLGIAEHLLALANDPSVERFPMPHTSLSTQVGDTFSPRFQILFWALCAGNSVPNFGVPQEHRKLIFPAITSIFSKAALDEKGTFTSDWIKRYDALCEIDPSRVINILVRAGVKEIADHLPS